MTTRSNNAEHFGQSLGRGWRSYRRTELRLTDWFVSKGIPAAVAMALLWAVKLGVLALLLYVAFWFVLLVGCLLLLARGVGESGDDVSAQHEGLRYGDAGFGFYSSDGHRLDPHDPNAPYDE
ncbi:DUF3742 family protein [Pseudomonas abyssi]